jgi:hypothetical protein
MDVFIAVTTFLLVSGMGYLGLHPTIYPADTPSKKRTYQILFGAFTLIALPFVIWQAILVRSAQNALQAQLAGIGSSIVDIGLEIKTSKTSPKEQPPPVMNKPGAARSHIHVTAVDLVSANSGEVIQARTHFENNGAAPITDMRNYIVMSVLPRSEDAKTQIKIEDSIFELVKGATRDLPIITNQVPPHSTILNSDNHGSHPLTPELLEKVRKGEYAIYLVGRIVYRDSNILRHSDYCSWTNGDVRGMKLCFRHNEEP